MSVLLASLIAISAFPYVAPSDGGTPVIASELIPLDSTLQHRPRAVAYLDGAMWLFGGTGSSDVGSPVTDALTRIDVRTGAVAHDPDGMPAPVIQGFALPIGDKIYHFPGGDGVPPNYAQSTIHRFDPADQMFAEVGSFAPGRSGISAIWHENDRPAVGCGGGCAYAFGGYLGNMEATAAIMGLNPSTGSLFTVGQLPTPRAATSAVWDDRDFPGIGCSGGCAYIFGGQQWISQSATTLDEIVQFNPATGSIQVVGHLPWPAYWTNAIWYGGAAYVFGSHAGGAQQVFRFDPLTGAGTSYQLQLDSAEYVTSVVVTEAGVLATTAALDWSLFRLRRIAIDPYEDLPRILMGEDIVINSGFNFKSEMEPAGFKLCWEEFSPYVQVPQLAWDAMWGTIDKYIDYDDGFCIPNLAAFDLFEAEAQDPAVARLRATGVSASFPILSPITGSASAFDEVASAISAVLTLISVHPWQTPGSTTVGHSYVLVPQCAEQKAVPAEVTLNYQYWGFLGAIAGGGAGAYAAVDIAAQPYVVGKGFGSEPANHLLHQEIVARHWQDKEESLQYGAGDTRSVTVSPGPATSYMSLSGTGWAATHILGWAGYNVDFGTEHKRLQLHNLHFDFHDDTEPLIVYEVEGVPGRDGWFVEAPVALDAHAQDPESCVSSFRLSADGTELGLSEDTWNQRLSAAFTDEGVHMVTGVAQNLQELPATHETIVKLDLTPPTSEHVSQVGEWRNGWSSTCVSLGFEAYDTTSGPAEILTEYGGVVLEGAERTHCTEGITRVAYWPYDVAGNQGPHRQTAGIAIDLTPPTSLPPVKEGEMGHEGWFRGCVDVAFVSTDLHPDRQTSGLETNLYGVNSDVLAASNSTTVCSEGSNLLNYSARDMAGNTGPTLQAYILIDNTKPSIELEVPPVAGGISTTIDVEWEAADALSGLYGPLVLEVAEAPLLGSPSSFEEVCTKTVFAQSDQDSCTYEFPGNGRFCFRAHVDDRANNEATSALACTIHVAAH